MKSNIPGRFPARLMDGYSDYPAQLGETMIQLEMEFGKALDAKRLAKAVDLTLDAEPVLGCRFVNNCYRPYFERLEPDKRSAFFTAKGRSEYEAFKSRPVDHRKGPQINVCLWQSTDGDRLLLKVAHQVADAAGVKDIAAILSGIYRQLSDAPDYLPSPNIREQRSLREVMRHVPLRAYPRIFWTSLRSTLIDYFPPPVHALYTSSGPREPLTYVSCLIPSDRVSKLVQYGHGHEATVNDVILTAAFRALAGMGNRNKGSHITMSTTIDLRRYIPSGRAPAVANLSYLLIFWPNIGAEPLQGFDATLERVVSITRYGKAHFFGLDLAFNILNPICKTMHYAVGKTIYRSFFGLFLKRKKSTHWFSNTGPIDIDSVTFGIPPSKAHIMPPVVFPPAPFMFSLSGYDGTLTFVAGAYPTQKDTIERFFDAVLKELPA